MMIIMIIIMMIIIIVWGGRPVGKATDKGRAAGGAPVAKEVDEQLAAEENTQRGVNALEGSSGAAVGGELRLEDAGQEVEEYGCSNGEPHAVAPVKVLGVLLPFHEPVALARLLPLCGLEGGEALDPRVAVGLRGHTHEVGPVAVARARLDLEGKGVAQAILEGFQGL